MRESTHSFLDSMTSAICFMSKSSVGMRAMVINAIRIPEVPREDPVHNIGSLGVQVLCHLQKISTLWMCDCSST